MPRRTSWLQRLPEIRRSVRESVRSHYERRDLERLFHIQPRAAQKLMQMVTVGAKVGRSALVDRIVLSDFLDRVAESDDPEVTLQARRNVPSPAPRRKLRHLIQLDCDVATLETMPGLDFVQDRKVVCIRENWRFGFGPKIVHNAVDGYDFGSVRCDGTVVKSLEFPANVSNLLQYFDAIVKLCGLVRQKTQSTLVKMERHQAEQKQALADAKQPPLQLG